MGIEQPDHAHVGKPQRAFAQARPVASAGSTEFRDMAERVGAKIAIRFRIRRVSDAERIQHKEKCPRHANASLQKMALR
jgi:hypothetical protein